MNSTTGSKILMTCFVECDRKKEDEKKGESLRNCLNYLR